MSQTDDKQLLTKAKDLVSQCDRCGTCLTVCPLFGIVDVEKSAARGKNSIVRALAAGALKPDGATLEATNFCLLCQACVDSCPNKIKTDQAMVNVRQYLTNRNGGVGIKYRMLGGIMKHKTIVKMAAMSLGIIRALKLGGLVPFGMAPEEYTKEQYTSVFKGPAALGGKTELSPTEKLEALQWSKAAPAATQSAPTKAERRAEAKAKGYEGEMCSECGNFTLVRNGTCMKCDTCGSTTGCS